MRNHTCKKGVEGTIEVLDFHCFPTNLMKNPLKASTKMCLLLFYSTLLLIVAAVFSIADDGTSTFQSISDGETVVSTGGTFELGFYSPDASNRRYVGIWYKKISVKTIVWVANRDTPLTDLFGVLKITNPGILVLNHNMSTIWSSNTSRTAQNPVARLLDSGNLVVVDRSDDDPENFLWQSFDYPGDTCLPGAKLGRNTVTGFNWHLRSWKSPQDPSPGNYTYQFGPKGYAEMFLREGSVIKFRSGPWNGVRFSGMPQLSPNPIYTYGLVFEPDEMYYSYKLRNNSILSNMVLTSEGLSRRYIWIDRTKDWFLYLTAQIDNCNNYAFCGVYGTCNIEKSPVCSCLKGFTPKFPNEWDLVDWSNGCVRKTSLNCTGDVFQKYSGLKLPSTEQSWFNRSMNLKECEMVCMKNCSCTAYTNLDIRDGGSGCLLWYGDLIDIRYLAENGQDIYIRMASSELDNTKIDAKYSESNVKKMRIIISTTVLSTGLLIMGLALLFYVWKKQHQKGGKLGCGQKEDLELPLFDLMTVVSATSNFSIENKLGEGGFGSVFKGTMKDGQEIAVKKLSKSSQQGLDEFKNEVTHIAKLQHRNLVKLLGYCIQEDEMMLIYEYMPNKSLDFFIFDQRRRMLLDWPKRFEIINGIARGILYLHQDSRLRVIHRDLKASNILLGSEFNPKISDFGLARSFGGNETKAKTKKVVGTYGYMSPEYAIDGFYSIKSDVYSFGVMVLEIVSGSKNRGFSHPDHKLNLLGHAWMLHTEGRPLELLDTSIEDSITLHEVERTILVGLLCVQQNPKDRPSMSAAILMLGGEGALPSPLKPGFYSERDLTELEASHSSKACSTNEVTISLLEAR
ncbi:G-type lectin S-receptor-like serine/threonine-protein kinase At4g27290 isoform X4 [Malus sylvestris]|uniref:G-type lectin S-receptor-like serine/threonine-protein kinase At4g27290 isoform X4 n=1 Tax=Malus sylvestris TaxID=3752 RepID=UPI0021ACEE24|nr:G-type lectin S-receptor-like serine/threonine-protein kinase At4g27290 isoform X4 [Malus sylvestris]